MIAASPCNNSHIVSNHWLKNITPVALALTRDGKAVATNSTSFTIPLLCRRCEGHHTAWEGMIATTPEYKTSLPDLLTKECITARPSTITVNARSLYRFLLPNLLRMIQEMGDYEHVTDCVALWFVFIRVRQLMMRIPTTARKLRLTRVVALVMVLMVYACTRSSEFVWTNPIV